ncbi:hypothetical protein BDD12DRAFT_139219 [Trichophaea hybrida]|nr:hypothetical protein BDD12DRAFT_139219 [Trichophaea hybrida]
MERIKRPASQEPEDSPSKKQPSLPNPMTNLSQMLASSSARAPGGAPRPLPSIDSMSSGINVTSASRNDPSGVQQLIDKSNHITQDWERKLSDFKFRPLREDSVFPITHRLTIISGMRPSPFSDQQLDQITTLLENESQNLTPIKSQLRDRFLVNDWYGATMLFLNPSAPMLEREILGVGETVTKLYTCWNDDYQGEALAGLMKTICGYEERWNTRERFYSKCINIFQSSGMGKSRLCNELGKHWLQCSFVLRKAGENGYPSGDPEIYKFLMDETIISNTAKILSLYAAVGEMGQKWTDDKRAACPDITLDALIRLWHQILQPVDRGGKMSPLPEEQGLETRSKERMEMYKQLVLRARELCTELSQRWHSTYYNGAFDEAVIESDEGLRRLFYVPICKLIETYEMRPFVLVFDEAANLNDRLLYWLRRLPMAFYRLPLWSLFLSTNNKIDKLFPQSQNDPSERLSGGALRRLDPILGLPVDVEETTRMVNLETRIQELRKSMSEFQTPQHVCMFGRPLWKVHGESYQKAVRFAQRKLLPGTYSPASNDQAFALLANRINLDPIVGPSSVELVRNAVNSHLRVVLYIDEKLGIMQTLTPSEPLVSDAATEVLMARSEAQDDFPRNWVSCIEGVAKNLLSTRIVDAGSHGELYARLVLILARDFTLSSIPPTRLGICTWTRPIKVLEFLHTLIAVDDYKLLMDYTPTARTQKPLSFAEAFKAAYINMNHFTKTDVFLQPGKTHEMLHDLLRRSAGLQLAHGQPAWDAVIPIYFGDLDAPFEMKQISAIVIQVKNKVSSSVLEIGPEKLNDFKYIPRNKPLLAILLELGRPYAPLAPTYKAYKSRPPCYGIGLSGKDQDTFAVLNHTGLKEVCPAFVRQVMPKDSVNAEVSKRNIRFNYMDREGRYPGYMNAAASVCIEETE